MNVRRASILTTTLQYITALGFVCFLAVLIAHAAHGMASRVAPAPVAAVAATPASVPTSAPAVAPAPAPRAADVKVTTGSGAVAAAATATAAASDSDAVVRELQGRHLDMPIGSVRPDQLTESFTQARTGHTHEALDILSPRGTPVLAVENGTIVKLFWSKQGGHTIYHFDPTRRFAYYYAHLDRYADGLKEGQAVRRGDTIGFVGSTGNADVASPHLHFGIVLLTPEQQWWKGTAVDPYPVLRWAIAPPTH